MLEGYRTILFSTVVFVVAALNQFGIKLEVSAVDLTNALVMLGSVGAVIFKTLANKREKELKQEIAEK